MEKSKSHCNILREISACFSSNLTYSFDFFSDNFHFVFVFYVIFTKLLFFLQKTSFFLQNGLFYCDVSFMFCLLFLTQTLNRLQPTYVTCWSRVGYVS